MAPARGARAEGPGPAHGLPRDHPRRDPAAPPRTPASSTSASSTPRRPAASSTGSTATRSARCSGARCAPACRPAASSRWRPGWSSSASASGWRSCAPATGTSRASSTRAASPRGSSPSTARASPPAVTSTPTAGSRPRAPSPSTRQRCASLTAGPRRRQRSSVRSVEDKPYRRSPAAPFMTSTLQQEASRKLRMTSQARDARRPAAVRERPHHLHAYRLDDAVGVGDRRGPRRRRPSSTAPRTSPRSRASTPARSRTPRRRTRRSARPATSSAPRASSPARSARDELALYDLIWKRTVASQMSDARGQTASVRLGATADRRARRRVRRVRHGHHAPRLPRRLRGGPRRARRGRRRRAPPAVDVGRRRPGCRVAGVRGPRDAAARPLHRGHAGQGARGARHRPPVDLRRHDLRRSSTAATSSRRAPRSCRRCSRSPSPSCWSSSSATSSTTTSRRRWSPTSTGSPPARPIGSRGCTTSTSATADGAGGALDGLKGLVDNLGDIDARDINSVDIGGGITLRVGRYGPYIERGEERASVPEDLAPDELTVAHAEELLAAPSGDHPLGTDPASGLEIVAKTGRYGPVRHRGAARGRAQEREAAHGFAVQGHEPRHGHARGRAAAAVAPARRRHRPRRRRWRSPRRTAATART